MREPRDHLVILDARTIRRLSRKRVPILMWSRRRREPPIGAVRGGDRLFLKLPGGKVVAMTRVTTIREDARGGRYTIRIRTRRPVSFALPFPVVKRDRRSWVVCTGAVDQRQQSLLALPDQTLRELVDAIRRHHRVIPRRQDIERALRTLVLGGVDPQRDLGTLLFLLILLAVKADVSLQEKVRAVLRVAPSHVFPFAVFRKRE